MVQLQFNVSLCLRKVIGIQEALNVNAVSDGAVEAFAHAATGTPFAFFRVMPTGITRV